MFGWRKHIGAVALATEVLTGPGFPAELVNRKEDIYVHNLGYWKTQERIMMGIITVKASWDDDAQVWYIEHSTLPGLHIEADTPIELYNKLPGAIEDLLEGSGEQEVSFEFIAPGRVKIAA